jgi:hypothetical protein
VPLDGNRKEVTRVGALDPNRPSDDMRSVAGLVAGHTRGDRHGIAKYGVLGHAMTGEERDRILTLVWQDPLVADGIDDDSAPRRESRNRGIGGARQATPEDIPRGRAHICGPRLDTLAGLQDRQGRERGRLGADPEGVHASTSRPSRPSTPSSRR